MPGILAIKPATRAAITDVHEELWSEFDGTDADNLATETLVATVTCRCGFITNDRMEYRSSVSDLITRVLRQASGMDDATADVSRRYGVTEYQRG